MKIGFVGTQGSGKTTMAYKLATKLKELGKDVTVITEVARRCPLPINENTTTDSQLWIIAKQITSEYESKSTIKITDRTLMDPVCYGYRINKDLFEKFIPFLKEYMKSYDIIVYMKPNDDYLIDDGIRSVNKSFRDEVDSIISRFISELDLNYIYGKDLDYILSECKLKLNEVEKI